MTTLSDAVLAFSFLFFMAMCLIPLWGPHVFFAQEKRERAQRMIDHQRKMIRSHRRWLHLMYAVHSPQIAQGVLGHPDPDSALREWVADMGYDPALIDESKEDQ